MKELKITLTKQSRVSEIDFHNLPFGKICTDHMFSADYVDGKWINYEIKPVEPLVMHPTNLALHYGQSIFEGMKASITKEGVPLLLRPEMHARRFNASARRMCMPAFPTEDFVEILHKLIGIDSIWIPPITGSSLYIRPLMFATDEEIGVKASSGYKFIILCLPVGPYYSRPVSLYAESQYIRAAKGGVGEAKCAGNYAAAMLPSELAKQKGFDQVLWLDAVEFKYIQEVGTMNIFFVIDGKVITPSTDGTILKGITRDCIITVLRDHGYVVEERPLSIDEVVEAYKNGVLEEVFGSGTAALVANISRIAYQDYDMHLPEEKWKASVLVKNEINGLRDGTIADTRGWTQPVRVLESVAH